MLVHRRGTPQQYVAGTHLCTWVKRDKVECQWSKVPCLRKQRDGRGLNTGPPDPEFEVLTTRPHTPPHFDQLISKPFFYSCYKPLPLYALLKPLAKIYKQRAYKWQFTGILIEIFLPINHLRQH